MDKECCICGTKFQGYGNAPWPVRDKGECCDICNTYIVIPERLKNLQKMKERNNNEK